MSYKCLNSGQGLVSPHHRCRQDGAPPTCHSHLTTVSLPFLTSSLAANRLLSLIHEDTEAAFVLLRQHSQSNHHMCGCLSPQHHPAE